MQNRNPYAAPQTNVARGDGVEEYGEVKVFSVSGRIGRVRYIAYSIGLSILALIVVLVAAGLLALADPTAAIAVVVIGYVVAAYGAQILPAIQRSHDMNVSGWLSLIVLVPLGPFVFWIVPGTRGENSYGKQPPPNSAAVIIVACIVPFLFFGSILAAIAIPAYQDYTIRAQVSEGLNLAVGPKAAVAEAYARSNEAPVDRSAAGLSPAASDTSGKYVESVDVAGGTILVTYGAEANPIIAGRVLGLQPYLTSDRAVVWRCGEGPAPQGAVAMDVGAPSAAGATDIDTIHLPSLCRSVIVP